MALRVLKRKWGSRWARRASRGEAETARLGEALDPRFEANVAGQAPAADQVERDADGEGQAFGEEGGGELEELGDADADGQEHAGAGERVQDEAHRAVGQLEAVGEQHPVGHGRDQEEGEHHGEAEGDGGLGVAAPDALADDERDADDEDRQEPFGREEGAPGGADQGRLCGRRGHGGAEAGEPGTAAASARGRRG